MKLGKTLKNINWNKVILKIAFYILEKDEDDIGGAHVVKNFEPEVTALIFFTLIFLLIIPSILDY